MSRRRYTSHLICDKHVGVMLLDDSRRVADRAREAGVDVTLEVFPEMQHVFQMGVGGVPESDDAIAKIGAFLRPRLGLQSTADSGSLTRRALWIG